MIEIMSLATSASTSGAAAKATLSSSSASTSATSPVLNVNVNHTSPAVLNQQPSIAQLNNPNCVPPPVSISASVSMSSSYCTSTSTNSTANMAKRRRLDCSEDGVVLGVDRGPSAFLNAAHSAVPSPLGPAIPPERPALFANDSTDTLAVPVPRFTRKCSSSSSTNNADRDNANGGSGIGALAQPLSHLLSNNIKTERRDSLLAADRRQHSESVSSAAAPPNAAIDSDHKGLLDSDDDEDDPYEGRKRELLDGKCLFNFSYFIFFF